MQQAHIIRRSDNEWTVDLSAVKWKFSKICFLYIEERQRAGYKKFGANPFWVALNRRKRQIYLHSVVQSRKSFYVLVHNTKHNKLHISVSLSFVTSHTFLFKKYNLPLAFVVTFSIKLPQLPKMLIVRLCNIWLTGAHQMHFNSHSICVHCATINYSNGIP